MFWGNLLIGFDLAEHVMQNLPGIAQRGVGYNSLHATGM
jgi:hypothetical protein